MWSEVPQIFPGVILKLESQTEPHPDSNAEIRLQRIMYIHISVFFTQPVVNMAVNRYWYWHLTITFSRVCATIVALRNAFVTALSVGCDVTNTKQKNEQEAHSTCENILFILKHGVRYIVKNITLRSHCRVESYWGCFITREINTEIKPSLLQKISTLQSINYY